MATKAGEAGQVATKVTGDAGYFVHSLKHKETAVVQLAGCPTRLGMASAALAFLVLVKRIGGRLVTGRAIAERIGGEHVV